MSDPNWDKKLPKHIQKSFAGSIALRKAAQKFGKRVKDSKFAGIVGHLWDVQKYELKGIWRDPKRLIPGKSGYSEKLRFRQMSSTLPFRQRLVAGTKPQNIKHFPAQRIKTKDPVNPNQPTKQRLHTDSDIDTYYGPGSVDREMKRLFRKRK